MEPGEILKEVKEVRREVIETRNLNIKSDNNMRSLFAELKKVNENQKRSEKKMRISSIGAYVLFVVIISTAAILLSSIISGNYSDKIEFLNQRIAKLNEEISIIKGDLGARDAAEKRSVYLLKLIEDDKKVEAVKEFRKIQSNNLSVVETKLLTEKIAAFAKALARKEYDKGVGQWRIGGYKSAIQNFEVSLKYNKDEDYFGLLSYFWGLSLLQLKKHDEGIEKLKTAIAKEIRKDYREKAMLKIADTYLKSKRWKEAIAYLGTLKVEELGYWSKKAVIAKKKYGKKRLDAENKAKELLKEKD